ncbi:hypothetical protein AVEN_200833-1 [Araneus ventricosus]|uniref:Uncharacterized protein n=1 Tax=Araneus ventricosus TaxID=182803 RepID=A0A4Y2CIN2_ARAVE|nr:hypothetical protein AVEN_200833-1 [Araneus ventricosus]
MSVDLLWYSATPSVNGINHSILMNRTFCLNIYFIIIIIPKCLFAALSSETRTFGSFVVRGALYCVTDRTTIGREAGSVPRFHGDVPSHPFVPCVNPTFPHVFFSLFPQSNPEAEEEQRLAPHGGESEFESDGEEEETEDLSPGVTAMSHLHVSGQERQQDSETIIARIKRREQEQLKQQHMEREYMAHSERLMRDEMGYLNSPESNHHHPAGNGSSKSATPSPTSPPPTQYLYAAGHPFSSALFNPSQMAAAAQAAAVAMASASAAHHHQIPPMSAGSSSAGSATPPNNGIGSMSSPRGAAGEGDQSKYTFEEQFKQVRAKVKSSFT